VESVIDGWFGDQQHYPSVLSVHPHVNRGFLAFEVLVHPWAARRDATDGRSHPRYTDGYELSFCLLRADELDLEQTRWVRAAVEHVAAERGIDPYSALALMAHLFLLDVELARARAGVPSLLRGTTWTYLQQERLFRDAQEARASANLLSGVFTFPRFQEFWEVYRPTLAASSFYMERDSRLGRTCYKTIPPIWLPAAPIASHDLTQAWIEALDSPALPTRRVPSDAWLDSVLANLRLTVIRQPRMTPVSVQARARVLEFAEPNTSAMADWLKAPAAQTGKNSGAAGTEPLGGVGSEDAIAGTSTWTLDGALASMTERQREIVRLWREGRTSTQIASRLGNVTSDSVNNRITELRAKYGTEVVPLHRR